MKGVKGQRSNAVDRITNLRQKRIHGFFQYHPLLILTYNCRSGISLVVGSHWDSEIQEIQYLLPKFTTPFSRCNSCMDGQEL